MENPASWTKTTYALQKAIRDHKAAQEAGAIGGSLEMYIETVVINPLLEKLKETFSKPVTDEEWTGDLACYETNEGVTYTSRAWLDKFLAHRGK